MRRVLPLLLLTVAVAAQPPVVQGYRRLRKLRDDILSQIRLLKEAEEYALKPAEEKMLIAFTNGEKKFDNRTLTGKIVVTTILEKWDLAQEPDPAKLSEPVKRVMKDLPNVLFEKYTRAIEVPRDRKDVANVLVDALDSECIHIRVCAFESLKLMYHTPNGLFYNPNMSKKERQDSIKKWKKLVGR